MHPPDSIPMLIGQCVLAVFIGMNTIISYMSSMKRREQERKDREEERKQEREDRDRVAADLITAQEYYVKMLKQITEQTGAKLANKLEAVHTDLTANTEVNVAALDAANNFNVKLQRVVERDTSSPLIETDDVHIIQIGRTDE